MNRPALRDMILRCQEDKSVSYVLVLDTDRLARNASDHLKIKTLLKQQDTSLISVNQPSLSEDTPEAKFMDLVIAGMNAFQSQITGRKVLKCMMEKFRDGWWPKEAPIGYINTNVGTEDKPERIIEPDPEMSVHVIEAFRLYSTGTCSIDKILSKLNSNGFRTNRGNKVSNNTLNSVLKNTFYYGLMEYNGESIIGKHEPLIEKSLYEKCQEVFREKEKRANRNRKHNFLLRGYVHCGICGYRLTAENHPKKAVSYYHCASKKHSNRGQNIRVEELEKRVERLFKQIELPKNLVDEIIKKAKDILRENHKDIDNKKSRLSKTIRTLENKRNKLESKLLSDVISDDDYKRIKNELELQIESIEQELLSMNIKRSDNVEKLENVLLLARNIGKAYKEAPNNIKQMYLGLFWERIEVKDCEIKKAVPTKIYSELFPTYNSRLTNNESILPEVITKDVWRDRLV